MIGKKVALRAMEPTDVDLLYKWENDPSVWKISNTLIPFSKFIIEQYVMSSDQDIFAAKQLRLMIDLASKDSSSKTIGTIDLFDFEPHHRRAGVAILIQSDYHGQGYASEALELLIDYSFKTLNLHQLYCNITVDNESSVNLFSKYGFKIIGIKKDWILFNNQWHDEYMLQLISE